MANEHLKRTPTSTGNKRVLTWSGWVKRHTFSNTYVGSQNFFRASNGSGGDCGWRFDYSTPSDGLRVHLNGSAAGSAQGDAKHRDPSSWMHVMLSFNSTLEQSSARVRMYVDGVLMPDNNTAYPAQNFQTSWNDLVPQYIGTYNGSTEFFHGEMCDIFMVDGQALTPDVFGFYKEGKGHQSSGTTQATDFRPGQWVPKAPRTIKTEINRRGGFGVNGFYLPMNDSSNFGADFHCTPNSIIKLKGEDLPQPRNGAPTTSDAYVSQLREDPYAANLVLAVPGIALENTNPELIINGTFDTNTTGWTLGTNSISSVVNGVLRARSTVSDLHNQTYQDVTTVIGTRYTVSATVKIESGGQPAWLWIDGNSVVSSTSTSYVTISYDFTATSTTTKVGISERLNTYTYYDNISLKVAKPIRDYSADIKGSGTNKTLTPVGGAGVGYETGGYYGSAMQFSNDGTNGAGTTDIINVPTSSDFVFNGDVTIECWMYVKSTPTVSGAFLGQWQSGGGTNRNLMMYLDTSNRVTSYFNSGGTNYNTGASPALALNQWHHIATEKDGDKFRLYVNGVCAEIRITTPTAGNTAAVPFTIGAETESGGTTTGADYGIDGYIQDVRVYKGVAKYKGGFDVPKPYTPVGIESWRTVPDNCSNNFPTLNPIHGSTLGTYSNGNLKIANSGVNNIMEYHPTIGMTSGKWYCEVRADDVSSSNRWHFGISSRQLLRGTMNQNGGAPGDITVTSYSDDSYRIISRDYNNVLTQHSNGTGIPNVVNGDILGVAVNITTPVDNWVSGDNFGTVQFYRNGSVYGPSVTLRRHELPDGQGGLSGNSAYTREWFFASHTRQSSAQTVNYGQNPTFCGQTTAGTYTDSNGKGLFKYEPPAGHLALCEDNLPAPAIADPGDYFKSVVYTGTGSSRAVTGVGFKPDFIWCKSRTNTEGHIIFDSVRGPEKRLLAMGTQAEATSTGGVMSFDDDGYSTAQYSGTNQSGQNYVAWCWKAGGAAVSNTDGTITSQVSANQDAGFSIVKWTSNGNTSVTSMGHGLGKTPKFMIHKRLGVADNWFVYHSDIQTNNRQYLRINTTDSTVTSPNDFWSTSSSTMGIRQSSIAANGQDCIAYCWAEIEGFSKIGSYIGNGNADGPFVYCGFKPSFVLLKPTSTTGNWTILDSSRSSINPVSNRLHPNLSDSEYTGTQTLDLLSNGFKIRRSAVTENSDGETYIFMAFAESPFQTANAK